MTVETKAHRLFVCRYRSSGGENHGKLDFAIWTDRLVACPFRGYELSFVPSKKYKSPRAKNKF